MPLAESRYNPPRIWEPPFVFQGHSPNDLPASTPTSISTEVSTSEESSASKDRGRAPNWSDAETRFLLELWKEKFPISKRRNGNAWDAIAKQLNRLLKENGLSSFRSGAQCKSRVKYLEDEYKRVKDHNKRSGNNRETFAYFEDMDAVMGCKPNITPVNVVHSGFNAENAPPLTSTPRSSPAPESESIDSSFSDEEGEPDDDEAAAVAKPPKQARGKRAAKEKKPPAKRARSADRSSSESTSDLMQYLEEGQKRDHQFFERLVEKEGERELQSQKLMFDMVKEVAKIFKGNN